MRTIFLTLAACVACAADVRLLTIRDEAGLMEAAIAPERGAELTSLKVRFGGEWIELLWRANDFSEVKGWTGRAPLLWPAVGRNFAPGVKANEEAIGTSWKLAEKLLPMPIHGFARDHVWEVVSQSADRVLLRWKDSERTREFYPFGFTFDIEYRATAGGLAMTHTITAAADNARPMPFSIGNHITFRVPFVAGDPLAMTFETPSTREYLKREGSVPSGETRARSLAKPVTLGALDAFPSAISLGGYEGEPWARLTDPAGLAVTLRHKATSLPDEPFLLFNVWGDAKNSYFSPEPWVGIQNSLNLEGGAIRLVPGARWVWELWVEISLASQ